MGLFTSATQASSVSSGSAVHVLNLSAYTGSGLRDVVLLNAGPAVLYAGGASVTSAAGLAIPAGGHLTVTGAAVNLYAITATGSASVLARLATTPAVLSLQDTLMATCGVDQTAPQVFDPLEYPGTAQTEPLAELGTTARPALLTWAPFTPILAGGPVVNPGSGIGDVVLISSGPSTVYAGSSASVTSATGVPVAPGSHLVLSGAVAAMWAACGPGQTATVRTGLATLAAVARCPP